MQSTPTIALGEWFDKRAANAAKGIPASAMPLFQYELTGPANGKGDLYKWDYTNFAPRVSAAWTPKPGGGWLKWLDRRRAPRGAVVTPSFTTASVPRSLRPTMAYRTQGSTTAERSG